MKLKDSKQGFGIIVILVILVLIGAVGFGGWYVYSRNNNKNSETKTDTTTGSTTSTIDSKLVGNWDTSCLVPDPNSPWAEQHKFTINSDGTATHQRFSGDSCAVLNKDVPQHYRITIPSSGKINFTGLDGDEDIYDIYKISGDNLYFGHGFCNCSNNTTNIGTSESNRFTIFNDFLAYKKK